MYGVLSQHKLVATGTTGKLIAEATGLQVQRFLAGVQGGDQQIASRIACNEIDLLLFFRDPINAKPSEPNEMTLLRLCDVHNIPMATNIATAEAIWTGATSCTPRTTEARNLYLQKRHRRSGAFFASRNGEP